MDEAGQNQNQSYEKANEPFTYLRVAPAAAAIMVSESKV